MNGRHTYTAFFLFAVLALRAQDFHFSQFMENTSLLSPALTGVIAPVRVSLNYRDQWSTVAVPYKTYGLSVESRFRPGAWEQVDRHRSMTFKQRSMGRVAAGFSLYSEKAGEGSFSRTQGNLTLATYVPLNRSNYISVGLQASIVQRRVNTAALIFPNQYNGTFYDPAQPSGEDVGTVSFSNRDYAAGLLWFFNRAGGRSGDRPFQARVGAAAYHITRPAQEFLAPYSRLPVRYVAHADLRANPPDSRMLLEPALMVQKHGPALEIQGGMMVNWYVQGNSHYTGRGKRSTTGIGLYMRVRDALIFALQHEIQEQFAIRMSYDFNVSSLSQASRVRGGPELTLRYTPPGAYLYQKK